MYFLQSDEHADQGGQRRRLLESKHQYGSEFQVLVREESIFCKAKAEDVHIYPAAIWRNRLL